MPDAARRSPRVWWLEGCKNSQNYCLGDLDAGTYKSQYITPRLDAGAGAQWAPDFGALTYTVPDGWANSSDFPERFSLTPSADFAVAKAGAEDGAHRIELHWQYAATAQNEECTSEELTSVPRTVDGLVGWIKALPSLDAGPPTAITIDGHPGRWLDVGVAPSWTTSCPGATQPIAVVLTEAGCSCRRRLRGRPGRARPAVFLDLGGGDLVMIDIYSPDPAGFDSFGRAGDADHRELPVRVIVSPAADFSPAGSASFPELARTTGRGRRPAAPLAYRRGHDPDVPFHKRTNALNETGLWSHWSGHLSAHRYQLSDKFEYFAVRNAAGIFDSSPLYKYRIHGATRSGSCRSPRPRHPPLRSGQCPVHGLVRRPRFRDRGRRHPAARRR